MTRNAFYKVLENMTKESFLLMLRSSFSKSRKIILIKSSK